MHYVNECPRKDRSTSVCVCVCVCVVLSSDCLPLRFVETESEDGLVTGGLRLGFRISLKLSQV